ncbi:HNH endonuclease signature motif containing protein [Brevibacterium sp. CSND-B09]|uniref:HNH endonuclease signature motif containing protein n=1 Tax=Brevibacterium sp. CSND-B09 TaxID=3462571 RepID=UPI00406A3CC3
MKGTTNRSTPDQADEPGVTQPSPRFAIRFESSMSRFAENAVASDRAHFSLLESVSSVVLEQVFIALELPMPEGSEPFRCETISASFERRAKESEENTVFGAAEKSKASPKGASSTRDASSPNVASSPADDTTGTGGSPSATVVLYDADFAREQLRKATEPEAKALPEFPELDEGICFSKWVYDNVDAEDLVEISTVLGTNTARTYRQLTGAMTIFYGLPRFADRVRAGEFTQAHVDVVARQCADVAFDFLPKLDIFLAARRADITCETLRRDLAKMIALLVPPIDNTEFATKRRRVDVEGYKDGSACLTVSGPSAEIFACYNRIQGMALAVHGKNKSAFNLPVGVEISDDRSISQLEYDLFTRPVPELKVKVISVDPITGIQTAEENSLLDTDGELIPDMDSDDAVADFAKHVASDSDDDAAESSAGYSSDSTTESSDGFSVANRPDGSAFRPDCSVEGEDPDGPIEYVVKLRMPTSAWWLSHQAATVVTVPFLSLTGDSDLPGTFADGSPVPVEVARNIAGRSKSIQRILTDPATGTPIDAKATTYQVPRDLRKTLVEQWTVCTVPGCVRRAEKSEIDHVVPFFHLDPLKGGLTRFGNLHPLCKKHHALKTAGRLRVTMPKSGELDYEFKHGISTTVSAPGQPINVAQALEFDSLGRLGFKRWKLPRSMVPAAPRVLELMPGESTIRQRDEEKRQREEREAHQRHLSEAYREQQAEIRRLRLERCLNWANSVHQLSLPAGSNTLTVKQLTGNAKYARVVRWARLAKLDVDDIDFDPNEPDKRSARTAAGPNLTGFESNSQSEDAADPKGTGADDPWDHRFVSKTVNWDHDLEVDPPPF